MRFESIFLTATIIALSMGNVASGQTVSRWLRVPSQRQLHIIRHPSDSFRDHGVNLHFKFEADPVKPLLRLIDRSFSETGGSISVIENGLPDETGLTLKDLDREAEEALSKQLSGESPIIQATDSASIATDSADILPLGEKIEKIGDQAETTASATAIPDR